MLDTIKLGIPLTQKQYEKIQAIAFKSDRDQWTLFNPTTGDLRFRRITGLAETDQNSYHREIRWDIPVTYLPPLEKVENSKLVKINGEVVMIDRTLLTIELSLPKFSYGHNIHLLYDFTAAIAKLKKLLEKQFNLQTRAKLIDISQWQVWRADCCYAWRMPNQQIAQLVLDSLKHLHYPRKKPAIYPTGIYFGGSTYSVKFYLKLPEFKAHDRKALIKAKMNLEQINCLENKADGVLRYEATLRRQYLQKQGIETLADLARPIIQFELDEELLKAENPKLAVQAVTMFHAEIFHPEDYSEEELLKELSDGRQFTVPDGMETHIFDKPDFPDPYFHKGGGFTVRKRDNPTEILRYFLDKFVGEHGMQKVDQVEAKLRAVYQDRKAGRLLGTWLCVQRLGVAKAKELFGKDAYYRDYRDMKKAGISLIETSDNLVAVKTNFLDGFKFEVPSEHVTNRFDDFADHDNVLNFIPRPASN